MYLFCYKVGERNPVVLKDVTACSAVITSRKYCDVAKEVGLSDKYPDALECEDKLFTVTGVSSDGSVFTTYDIYQFEGS